MNTPSNMAGHNQPPLEVWRLKAREYVALNKAARMLENSKSAVLSRRMGQLTAQGVSVSAAERQVKASPEWQEYLDTTEEARAAADFAWVEREYAKEKMWEIKSGNADARAEMRMTGS